MKKITNFQFIWKEWIMPLAEDLLKEVDTDFCQKTYLKKRDMEELFVPAEKYFKKKRKELKIVFYGNGYKDKVHRMDFHKLSAVLCRTLIQYKVFDFDITECEKIAESKDEKDIDWLVKNALINFRLAFYASVVFLYQSMLFEYDDDEKGNDNDNNENKKVFKKLKEKECLDLYENHNKNFSNGVHESFENSVVLDLSKRDINNKSFDFLMYATIMYQLEEYNKAIL